MLLFIDTSDQQIVRLALINEGVIKHQFQTQQLSESLIVEIKKFCQKQKIKLNQIKKIAVVVGPGGFSRIRTAVATANALAFGLNIPVIGLKLVNIPTDLKKLKILKGEKLVKPMYDHGPNITFAK